MRRNNDEIAYTQIFEGPGFYVKVNHPKLTPEEYERRHKQIHDAAARVLIAQQRAGKHKETSTEESAKKLSNETDKE